MRTPDTGSTTLLIVEDEQPLADLYARFLDSTYTVRTAHNGAEALDSMCPTVDVVLLDRRMPGLSGEEVLQAIRTEGYNCRVAMVTAVTPEVDIIEMGFDDYLTKPIGRTELNETVNRLVELNAHDDLIQEYYRLSSKKAALEVENADIDIVEDTEFDQLIDRLNDLEVELQTKRERASEPNFRSLLNRPGTSSDGD